MAVLSPQEEEIDDDLAHVEGVEFREMTFFRLYAELIAVSSNRQLKNIVCYLKNCPLSCKATRAVHRT